MVTNACLNRTQQSCNAPTHRRKQFPHIIIITRHTTRTRTCECLWHFRVYAENLTRTTLYTRRVIINLMETVRLASEVYFTQAANTISPFLGTFWPLPDRAARPPHVLPYALSHMLHNIIYIIPFGSVLRLLRATQMSFRARTLVAIHTASSSSTSAGWAHVGGLWVEGAGRSPRPNAVVSVAVRGYILM